MAINIVKRIKEFDACSILLKKEQQLFVENVSEFKKSTKEKAKDNQYYCYVDYVMEDGTKFGVSYTFYLDGDVFKCGTSSKLYHLMKGILNLNPLVDTGLEFEKNDISETLLNRMFLASAIVQSIGGKNYPYIVLEKEIIDEL